MDCGLYTYLTSRSFGLPITTVPMQVFHSIGTFTFKCFCSQSGIYTPSIHPYKINMNIWYSIQLCLDLTKVSYLNAETINHKITM